MSKDKLLLNKLFFIILFVLTHVAFPSEHHCSKCDLGFRRTFVTNTSIQNIPDQQPWDVSPFFSKISEDAETLRSQLIDRGVFGTLPKDIESEKQSIIERNVACFSFFFFDESGKSYGPYFFRSDSGNITSPFFFFSGRAQLPYQNSDHFGWDALSETAIKEEDGKVLKISPIRNVLPNNRLDNIRSLTNFPLYIDILERSERNLFEELKLYVWHICDREPFFDYLKKREKRAVGKEICKPLLNITIPKVEAVPGPNQVIHYRPHEDTKYFVHSEQVALYKMSRNLENFIDKCKDNLAAKKVENVNKIAICTYTRNTMCARCAHSIIIDFCHCGSDKQKHGYESFLVTFNKKFPSQNLQFVFLTSARYAYESHVQPDGFEKAIRLLMDNPQIDIRELRFGSTCDPQTKIEFMNFPHLIYHYHIEGAWGAKKQYLINTLKSFQGGEYANPTTNTGFEHLLSPTINENKEIIKSFLNTFVPVFYNDLVHEIAVPPSLQEKKTFMNIMQVTSQSGNYYAIRMQPHHQTFNPTIAIQRISFQRTDMLVSNLLEWVINNPFLEQSKKYSIVDKGNNEEVFDIIQIELPLLQDAASLPTKEDALINWWFFVLTSLPLYTQEKIEHHVMSFPSIIHQVLKRLYLPRWSSQEISEYISEMRNWKRGG